MPIVGIGPFGGGQHAGEPSAAPRAGRRQTAHEGAVDERQTLLGPLPQRRRRPRTRARRNGSSRPSTARSSPDSPTPPRGPPADPRPRCAWPMRSARARKVTHALGPLGCRSARDARVHRRQPRRGLAFAQLLPAHVERHVDVVPVFGQCHQARLEVPDVSRMQHHEQDAAHAAILSACTRASRPSPRKPASARHGPSCARAPSVPASSVTAVRTLACPGESDQPSTTP